MVHSIGRYRDAVATIGQPQGRHSGSPVAPNTAFGREKRLPVRAGNLMMMGLAFAELAARQRKVRILQGAGPQRERAIHDLPVEV
jgi:hypothetical protein